MTTRALAHRSPSVTVSVTVVIDADKTLLFVAGLVWLVWLYLARAGRFVGDVWDWLRAAGRVIWRRLRGVKAFLFDDWGGDLRFIYAAVWGGTHGTVWA